MVEIGNMKSILPKALEIRYILMDCCLVDIQWLTDAFGRNRMLNLDIKLSDGAAIYAYSSGIGEKLFWANRICPL